MVFLILASVNKSVRFGLKKKQFLFIIFRKKKDKHVLHIRFAFHSKSLRTNI